MSTTMTAKEISEAWLAFVNDTFLGEDGCGRPDADEKLKLLEERGELRLIRESGRAATDMLINEILRSQPESRRQLFATSDATSLALVHDRVQSVTQLLIGLVEQGVQVNAEAAPELEWFFRQMLLQREEPQAG
jgi:hypothetical protein